MSVRTSVIPIVHFEVIIQSCQFVRPLFRTSVRTYARPYLILVLLQQVDANFINSDEFLVADIAYDG